MNRQWLPGIPGKVEPDRIYAVLEQRDNGLSVGCVIRGEDCNWKSTGIIGYYPLPLTMNEAEARRLQRSGEYTLPEEQADMIGEEEFLAKRLRVLAKVLGCEEALPDDSTAVACAGTVLGTFRREAEHLQQKLTGHRLMLGQIGGILERTPEINYSNYRIEEVQAQNEAIIEISQLIGTFEDKPEDVAPKCKDCGYEAENKALQRQVKDLAMMVKLLCRKAGDTDQTRMYMGYLKRKGLQGSPLREGEEATDGR